MTEMQKRTGCIKAMIGVEQLGITLSCPDVLLMFISKNKVHYPPV